MDNTLSGFFQPRGIAILGASGDPSKLGYAVTKNLIDSGYPGAIHLVNPKGGSLFGLHLYKNIGEIPDPVDLAVVVVPAQAAPITLEEIGKRGIKSAVLTSGGFRETGPEGAELETQVVNVCRQYNIRLIGPNCVGLIDTHFPFDTTFLPPPMPQQGEIAFVSHSGAFCAAVIDWSRGQGFGFSRMVSLGNQADLTETDLLNAVAADPATKTICLYLETISNGNKFLAEALKITPTKPIVALKVGRTESGQKAAASHTGALAGSESALNATLEKAGIFRAGTAEELFDWARALSSCPLPAGRNIAILTSAGGPGVIASDALEMKGLHLAEISPVIAGKLADLLPAAASVHNPIDMLASASPVQYAGCLELLLADENVNGVMVITLPPPSYRAEDIADALIPIIQNAKKPVIVAQMGSVLTAQAHAHFVKSGIPVYHFPERAASAFNVLAERADFLTANQSEPETRQFPAIDKTIFSAEEIIAEYGISTAPIILAETEAQAAEVSKKVGFPLAAKIASPDILHKSDIGGVMLNINTEIEIRDAYKQLMMRAGSARPDAQIDGITLQRQIGSGQDLIIGAIRDPQFGPLMMFGSGGVEAEGIKDVAFGLAPLTKMEAEKMIMKTWAGKKLDGFRNIPAVDRSLVIDALIRLSWLICDHSEISEIEINPLRAMTDGVTAIDIRMKIP